MPTFQISKTMFPMENGSSLFHRQEIYLIISVCKELLPFLILSHIYFIRYKTVYSFNIQNANWVYFNFFYIFVL